MTRDAINKLFKSFQEQKNEVVDLMNMTGISPGLSQMWSSIFFQGAITTAMLMTAEDFTPERMDKMKEIMADVMDTYIDQFKTLLERDRKAKRPSTDGIVP